MNNLKWNGAELTIILNDVEQTLNLTNTQFLTVAKILGLNFEVFQNGLCCSCYDDATLKRIWEYKANPLKAKITDKGAAENATKNN